MSLRPIDHNTTIVHNNEASNLRENQKLYEAGQAEHIDQHKQVQNQKTEKVQSTQNPEGKVIRKEDEESEAEAKKSKKQLAAAKAKEKNEKPKEHPKIPDSIRGFKVDIKI